MLRNGVFVTIIRVCAGYGQWYPSPRSSLLYRDFDTTEYGAVESSGEFLCKLRREINVTVGFIGKDFKGVVADRWGVVGCVVEEGLRDECGDECGGERGDVQADGAVKVCGREVNGFCGGWFGGFRFVGFVWCACGFCRSTSNRAWEDHWCRLVVVLLM